jgi:predicted heme/steroid binding protein
LCEVERLQKREWVGLTDDEIYDYADKFLYQHGSNFGIKSFGKAIEAKLKEKNT